MATRRDTRECTSELKPELLRFYRGFKPRPLFIVKSEDAVLKPLSNPMILYNRNENQIFYLSVSFQKRGSDKYAFKLLIEYSGT